MAPPRPVNLNVDAIDIVVAEEAIYRGSMQNSGMQMAREGKAREYESRYQKDKRIIMSILAAHTYLV